MTTIDYTTPYVISKTEFEKKKSRYETGLNSPEISLYPVMLVLYQNQFYEQTENYLGARKTPK